jgi:hypothetical protein
LFFLVVCLAYCSSLKMEAAHSSETSFNTGLHIPKDRALLLVLVCVAQSVSAHSLPGDMMETTVTLIN